MFQQEFPERGIMRKIAQAIFWFACTVFTVSALASVILHLSYPDFDHPTQRFPSYGQARTLGCLTETVYQVSPDYPTFHYFGLSPRDEKSQCDNLSDMGKMKFHDFYITVSPDLPDVILRALINAPRLHVQEKSRRTYLYRHVVSCENNPLCKKPDQYLILITETKNYPDNTTVEYYSRRLGLQLVERDGRAGETQNAEVFTRGYEYMEGGLMYWLFLAFCSFIVGLMTFTFQSLFRYLAMTKRVG
jgi:hypothetical protein